MDDARSVWEEKVLDVLPLVMQHYQPDTYNPLRPAPPAATQLLCTLLQVSNSMRAALRQSGVCCNARTKLTGSTQTVSLASWVRQHGAFLATLRISFPHFEDAASQQAQLAATALLADALQQHSPSAAAAAAAGVLAGPRTARPLRAARAPMADVAGRQQPQARPALLANLTDVALYRVPSPAALQALAAAPRLTRLTLNDLQRAEVTPPMLDALASLTDLRQLGVNGYEAGPHMSVLPAVFATAIGRLTQLTSLEARDLQCQPDLLLELPVSLSVVTLRLWHEGTGPLLGDLLQLDHLVSVRDADLILTLSRQHDAEGADAPDLRVVLPPNLTKLDCGGCINIGALPASLRHVTLGSMPCVLSAAPRLPSLHGLNDLCVNWGQSLDCMSFADRQALPGAFEAVASVLGSLAGLTSFELVCGYETIGAASRSRLAAALGQLHGLQRLSLFDGLFSETDVLQLSSLTRLERLRCGGPGLTDLAVVSLALKLSRLQRLYLDEAVISSQAVLPVIGRLSGLRELHIESYEGLGVTDLGLMSLTGLTRLTRLHLSESEGASSASGPGYLV